MQLPASGQCQCGACAYSVDAEPFVAYTCHCIACQKLTSSAFATLMQVRAERVSVTRGDPQSRDRVADSGNVLTTWSCAVCGSALFACNSARPRIYTVWLGTLDSVADVEVNAHIWVKRKLPWVHLPEQHRTFEEQGDWTEDYARDPSRYRP